MRTVCYYIQNCPELEEVIGVIRDKFISFVDRDYVEMDYSEVRITVRFEDLASIERLMVPLV